MFLYIRVLECSLVLNCKAFNCKGYGYSPLRILIKKNICTSCYHDIVAVADISEVGGTRNNGYFVLNRQIQFNCVYDNTAFVFVSFGHNGSRITSTGRFYIQDSHTHHSLVVSHTVPSDSGTWSCTLRSLVNQRTITRTTTVTYEG